MNNLQHHIEQQKQQHPQHTRNLRPIAAQNANYPLGDDHSDVGVAPRHRREATYDPVPAVPEPTPVTIKECKKAYEYNYDYDAYLSCLNLLPPTPAPMSFYAPVSYPTSSSYGGSNSETKSGESVVLIVLMVVFIGGCFVCGLIKSWVETSSSSSPSSSTSARQATAAGRWQTTNPQTATHGHPFNSNRPTNTTTRPNNAARPTVLSPADRHHQEALDLVKSMTRQERRDYVANFLRTQKYVDPDETKATTETTSTVQTNSGRFIVSQSSRKLHTNTTAANESAFCAICLEAFTEGEDICLSQNAHCPHQFHLTCAFEWLLSSQECPCCRRDYLSIDQVLSSRRVVAPTSTASAPLSASTTAAPESAPTAPLESDLPVESELPAESEVEIILPPPAAAVTAPSNRRVENTLTPQEILRRSVPPERLDV